jgi:hypothetical protein
MTEGKETTAGLEMVRFDYFFPFFSSSFLLHYFRFACTATTITLKFHNDNMGLKTNMSV